MLTGQQPTAYLVQASTDGQRRCDQCDRQAAVVVAAPGVRTLYRCIRHWVPVRWVLEARHYLILYGPGVRRQLMVGLDDGHQAAAGTSSGGIAASDLAGR